MPPQYPSLAELKDLIEGHGATDLDYLAHHFQRFASTLLEFDRSWDRARGIRVLDIGAHWLHQAVLWRRAGYEVTAVDMPITFEFDSVRRLAEAEGIPLVPNADLEHATGLKQLPDDSVDIVLFTEIIEHLTFNPVEFWRQVYRVLAPRGRILITTPNYYAWNGRMWDPKRFLSGFAGGISVDDILGTNTYGHHWREFSRHELIRYFCLLSPDFNTVKAKTMRNYYPAHADSTKRFLGKIFERIPGLRPNLHLEVELACKTHGIVIKPSW